MVKCILSFVIGMIVLTFVKAEEVENYDTITCNNVYCQTDEECCFSPSNGAVCCPKGKTCDSTLGCIENIHNSSTTELKECPPLTTECLSTPLFDMCCPLPFAECCIDKIHCCPGGYECCSDMLHCCPRGYECDKDNKHCNKKNDIGIYTRIFKREASTHGMKHCGDETWCPENDECCKNKNGGWNCCQAATKSTSSRRKV